MAKHPRDWLKQTHRKMEGDALAFEARERSPAETRALMVKVIIDSARARGRVEEADFIRANIPREQISLHFKTALSLAREEAPDIDRHFTEA